MSGLLKAMNMEFACDQCEYEVKTKGMLKIHHISLRQDLKLVQACLRAPHVVADEAKLAIVFTYFFSSS